MKESEMRLMGAKTHNQPRRNLKSETLQWSRPSTQSISLHSLIEKKKESKLLIWWNQINIIKVTKWKKIMKILIFFIWFHWAAAGGQTSSAIQSHFINSFISLWKKWSVEWNWRLIWRKGSKPAINSLSLLNQSN